MTRCTLSIALALVGLNAQAAWERIVQDPSADIYVDPKSIKRVGGLATMQTLTNLSPPKDPAQAAAMSFRSTIQHDDYDCMERKVRLRHFTMYS
jgi:hypothetical protein